MFSFTFVHKSNQTDFQKFFCKIVKWQNKITGLEIHENSARDIPPAGCLIIVDVDPLQLKIAVAMVRARGVDALINE